jgi:hypothetical protein
MPQQQSDAAAAAHPFLIKIQVVVTVMMMMIKVKGTVDVTSNLLLLLLMMMLKFNCRITVKLRHEVTDNSVQQYVLILISCKYVASALYILSAYQKSTDTRKRVVVVMV